MPNPEGTGPGSINSLAGVTCSAARDCWAVGFLDGDVSKPTRNQALHWTGGKWKVVLTPNPGGKGKGDVQRADRRPLCLASRLLGGRAPGAPQQRIQPGPGPALERHQVGR